MIEVEDDIVGVDVEGHGDDVSDGGDAWFNAAASVLWMFGLVWDKIQNLPIWLTCREINAVDFFRGVSMCMIVAQKYIA